MARDLPPTLTAVPERSLVALESFLRVIRIPRDDVRAMVVQVGPQVETLFEAGGPSAADAGSGLRIDAVDGAPAAAGAGRDAAFEDLPRRVRALYELAATPRADAIGVGRAALLTEVLANVRDGRFASAVALTITQIDGVAADVPPTPRAAFPFVVADERDRETVDPLLTASVVATHPGARLAVATLISTARPDSGPADAVHRHGIMHGRDLGYGTREHAAGVLCVLEALVAWAEPVARARVAAGRIH